MKFRVSQRRNPFDNPLLALLLHAIAVGGMCVAVYLALIESTLLPIFVGFAVLTILEALWLYFRLRN